MTAMYRLGHQNQMLGKGSFSLNLHHSPCVYTINLSLRKEDGDSRKKKQKNLFHENIFSMHVYAVNIYAFSCMIVLVYT